MITDHQTWIEKQQNEIKILENSRSQCLLIILIQICHTIYITFTCKILEYFFNYNLLIVFISLLVSIIAYISYY